MADAIAKLGRLRRQMEKLGVDAFIVPTADPHNSEYPPRNALRRAYISGFTGSAGTAVISQNHALLWTDGRYYAQAMLQLHGASWTLMRGGESSTPSIEDWIASQDGILNVGYDPFVTTISLYKGLAKKLKNKVLTPLKENPIDAIWEDRPKAPKEAVFIQEVKHAGVDVPEKIEKIRKSMPTDVSGVVLSRLDDVAWITNLRGSDVDYNPVFLGYVFLTRESFVLYTDSERLEPSAVKHLERVGCVVRPYDTIFEDLATEYGGQENAKGRLWLDEAGNMQLYHQVQDPDTRVHVALSPVQLPKAVKNDTEIQGFVNAHIRDAVAECIYLSWLTSLEPENLAKYNEKSCSDVLDSWRAKMPDCVGLSFNSISGMNENGAIIHYDARKSTPLTMTNGMYLIDSGGQYRDGTTDITRTIHLGNPSEFQKTAYTLVLKGHLHLARLTFPAGTRGSSIDTVARQYLWSAGLDYQHGTGHGVGSFLNVHEGPQRIAKPPIKNPGTDEFALEPGMVVSNEPGYYKNGHFGCRIENLQVCVLNQKPSNVAEEETQWLTFKTLTMVPYARELIDTTLLSSVEIDQINKYHQDCVNVVGKEIQKMANLPDYKDCRADFDRAYKWLENAAAPL